MSDPELHDWIQKYKPLLKSIAAKEIDKELVQKIDDSDVIQEALQAARAKFDRIEPKNPKEVRGYLRRILLSKIEDLRRRFIRSKKRDVRREVPDTEITSDEIRQIVGVDGSQLDTLVDEEHFRRVMTAVQELPTEIQRVLSWRFEHDMTFEQIGEKIGRTKDDVRMLIQRCVARLKKQLDES
ncbi:MAG: sigma-70 family RNA polymerase sigma factor [Planctomycetes bacterium]|jgi:RNA polymerase sigma-70 factor (ECF subfamily)|nr:sigma-70 family RNA polymerase sigma factor [Planctomycetota bacterium]